jgi:hypothetical protein
VDAAATYSVDPDAITALKVNEDPARSDSMQLTVTAADPRVLQGDVVTLFAAD